MARSFESRQMKSQSHPWQASKKSTALVAGLESEWYSTFTPGREGVSSMRDVEKHAQRRKLFERPFSKSALRGSWEPVVKEKVQLAVSQIRGELGRTGVCDILKWATILATNLCLEQCRREARHPLATIRPQTPPSARKATASTEMRHSSPRLKYLIHRLGCRETMKRSIKLEWYCLLLVLALGRALRFNYPGWNGRRQLSSFVDVEMCVLHQV